MANGVKHDGCNAGARIASLLLPLLALVIVGLASGCRRPAPSARGWARLEALLPLHPNQGMLADIDRRLDALAAQRSRLLEHPDAPLPPEYIAFDLPAADSLPAPAPVRAPSRPVIAVEPRQAELRVRLEEEMTHQYARVLKQAESERQDAYVEKERELQRRTDDRREAGAKEYEFRIPPAKVRLRLANEQAARARNDAVSAQSQATRAREHAVSVARQYAKNPEKHRKEIRAAEENAQYYENRAARLQEHAEAQQAAADAIAGQLAIDTREFAAAQARIGEELRHSLAAVERELEDEMRDRLADWRRQAENAIDRRLTEHAARLTDENVRPLAEAPPVLEFPTLPFRPMTTQSGGMRIAVNTTDFHAFQRRLDAARAIDETVLKLTAEREQHRRAIDHDTRAAARAAAAQHNYTVAFDRPAGREITSDLHRWLAEYWPIENGEAKKSSPKRIE